MPPPPPSPDTDAPLQVYGYKGALLKAFLQLLLSPVGQAAVAQFEFTALPPRLLAVAQAAAGAIQVVGNPSPGPWVFETASGATSYADNSTSTNATGYISRLGWVGLGLGQAASTLSVNRLSWATYQRNYNSLNVSILQVRENRRLDAMLLRACNCAGRPVAVAGRLSRRADDVPLSAAARPPRAPPQGQLAASQAQVQALQATVNQLNASLAALTRQARAYALARPGTGGGDSGRPSRSLTSAPLPSRCFTQVAGIASQQSGGNLNIFQTLTENSACPGGSAALVFFHQRGLCPLRSSRRPPRTAAAETAVAAVIIAIFAFIIGTAACVRGCIGERNARKYAHSAAAGGGQVGLQNL